MTLGRVKVHQLEAPAGASGSLTVAADGTVTVGSGFDPEAVRDAIGAALVAGANVTVTVNDPGDTITIAATLDTEGVRDALGATLVAGDGVTITVDDAANTVTIAAPARLRLAPLTTVIAGEPQLVWDEDNNLVMTEVPG